MNVAIDRLFNPIFYFKIFFHCKILLNISVKTASVKIAECGPFRHILKSDLGAKANAK
jgi:hypothetical protein